MTALPRMRPWFLALLGALPLAFVPAAGSQQRARAMGIVPGALPPGPRNSLTDVAGVRVGHATVIQGDSIRTGVTAILPHGGNPFFERVPAAVHVGNGFGKLIGSTQANELGELESPILLTCTLCVWSAADALVGWMLEQEGMNAVRSLNPLVAETNDGFLSAIRTRPVGPQHVRAALASADTGVVPEGSVGAGTGTIAFGWKGGIGSASRRAGDWTVGVLVQANFGGDLMVMGTPIGRLLGRTGTGPAPPRQDDGSVIIVVATDAPLSDRNLRRLASRAMMGLGRTGSSAGNGSGDYVIAFSTATAVRRDWRAREYSTREIANAETSRLFQAVVEATEEAVYNALFMATTVTGNGNRAESIPVEEVLRLLRR